MAVIGDGAMTGGVAFEAVSQAGGFGTRSWSCSTTTACRSPQRRVALAVLQPGAAQSQALARTRGRRGRPDQAARRLGSRFERLGPHLKESIKAFWAPGLWWEELDWAYMGVIDGHDVRAVRRRARGAGRRAARGRPHRDGQGQGLRARRGRRPGGHGDVACRQAKVDLNGTPAPAVAPARAASPVPPQYTQVFGEALVRECERDDRVVGITAAMNSGTG